MDTQKIDWTQPVETVDGVLMQYEKHLNTGQDDYPRFVTCPSDGGVTSFYSDAGKPWSSYKPDLRNVAPEEAEWGPEIMRASVVRNGDYIGLTPVNPATPTRTALEQRMHSLIKHAAVNASGYTQEEARAILAELEPVDGDLLIAREMVKEHGWAKHLLDDAIELTQFAIKRGRALERGE